MMLGLSAVAFATILAVVSGLALAGASAISHDLYANVIRKGQATEAEEVRIQVVLINPGRPRRPARHRVRAAERGVHGRSGLRRRRLVQFPGADPVDVLEGMTTRARSGAALPAWCRRC